MDDPLLAKPHAHPPAEDETRSPTSVAPVPVEDPPPPPNKTPRPRASTARTLPPPRPDCRARPGGVRDERAPPPGTPARPRVSASMRPGKEAISSPLDTKSWGDEAPVQRVSCNPADPDLPAAHKSKPGRVPQVMPTLTRPPCASLVNDPAGNSRASSSSFSAASFSSSLTSTSSLSETEKHFVLPPEIRTNCEQLEDAIEAEALSPPPPEMPSFPMEDLPEMAPMPANVALQVPVPALGTNSKSPSPDKPDPSEASEDSIRERVEPTPMLCDEPLRPISSAELSDALHSFTALKLCHLADNEVCDHVRRLLNLLDVLKDKIPLPLNERLFTALAEPKILMALVGLMEDTSVLSAPRQTFEALNRFRYPYVVGNILAGPKLADACLAYPAMLDKILDILDVPQGKSKPHPVVFAHTVNVLVTYLEYSPEPLLSRLEARPAFLTSVVGQLHLSPVVELLSSLLHDRCVDAVGNMDPGAATFEPALEMGLQVLAKAQCFHLLSEAFSQSGERAVKSYSGDNMSASSGSSSCDDRGNGLHVAEQVAYNCAESFKNIIELTVRMVRIDKRSLACIYLNVFNNPSTSKTVGHMLSTGIDVYSKTQGQCDVFLITAMSMVTEILRMAEADSVKRVASVAGQPDPLMLESITSEVCARLTDLVLIATGRFLGDTPVDVSARIRMHVIELMGTCQRMCSPEIFEKLDKLRFGEVAFKMMLLHRRNSMVHATVVSAVESALLSDRASFLSRRHWLVNSQLTKNIVKTWKKESGCERWSDAEEINQTPFLSTILHLACCVHHWIACCHANSIPGDRGVARELIGDNRMDIFTRFFSDTMQGIIAGESGTLGGERPRRTARHVRSTSMTLGSLRRTVSVAEESSNSWSNSSTGVHLVRSMSAHRFGYSEPAVPKAKSNFADIFDGFEEDNGNDFGLTLQQDTFAFIRAASEAQNSGMEESAAGESGGGSLDGGGLGGGLTMSRSQSSLLRSSPSREMMDCGGPDPFD